MAKRATFFDDSSYSGQTRTEYMVIGARYCVAAHRDGEDDLEPATAWLARYLRTIRLKNGLSCARKHASAIGHHMRTNGKPNLCNDPLVDGELAGVDVSDPMEPHGANLPADREWRYRAQYFHIAAYNEHTLSAYRSKALRFSQAMEHAGFDVDRPPADEVVRYLEAIAEDHAYSTVVNYRNALSYHFRKTDSPDLARTIQMAAFLEKLRREKPGDFFKPLSPAEREKLLTAFGKQPADIRDRVLGLFVAFGRYSHTDAVLVCGSMCEEHADGYVIKSEDSKRFGDAFIGGCDDPEFDIRVWLPKLLAFVGDGPLFQGVERGGFNGVALSPAAANGTLRRAARIAGMHQLGIIRRLRAAFDATVVHKRGAAVTAHHRGKRTLRQHGDTSNSEAIRRERIQMKKRVSKTGALVAGLGT